LALPSGTQRLATPRRRHELAQLALEAHERNADIEIVAVNDVAADNGHRCDPALG
jgi:hypothetical protein